MTRIIGGIAGSIKLVSPAKPTRPTSDRIREAIFNRLEAQDAISGLSVLDLYAGTGALALEAISRGADRAMMVEKDSKAAAVCIKNSLLVQKALEKAGESAGTKVVNKSVSSFLSSATEYQATFDLVFIDPPYEISNSEITENLEQLLPLLKPEAIVVVERSSRSGEFANPGMYQKENQKNYGDTEIFWFQLIS